MKKIFLLFAALALCAQAHAAGNAGEGQKKSAVCAACHGPDGNAPIADYPRLAGQHYDYLVKALGDYKGGMRKNPIMGGQAQNLSAQDIQDLAAYFSGQHGDLHIVPLSRFKGSGH